MNEARKSKSSTVQYCSSLPPKLLSRGRSRSISRQNRCHVEARKSRVDHLPPKLMSRVITPSRTPPVVNSMGIPQLPCPSFRRRWPRGWPDATLPRLTCTRKLSDALNVVEITPDVSILKFKIRHTDELSVLP